MHRVLLRSPDFLEERDGPSLLQRTDQRFMAAVLSELADEGGQSLLRESLADDRHHGDLRLYQPVHRVHQLAVSEACCSRPGHPRLDPARIESAGLVLRRLQECNGELVEQGWMRRREQNVGWRDLDRNRDDAQRGRYTGGRASAGESPPEIPFVDPDPERRRLRGVGPAHLEERLRELRGADIPLTESVTSAFVAPTRLCEQTGRTLIYGVVPVEPQEAVESQEGFAFDDDTVARRLPPHFKRDSGVAVIVPRGGEQVYAQDAKDVRLSTYVSFLRQLAIEFDLFGNTQAASDLREALGGLTVRRRRAWTEDHVEPALDHLKAAIRILVEGGSGSTRLPREWDPVSEDQEERIREAVQAVYRERLAEVGPRRGRFDAPDRRYVVRVFLRVRSEDECCPPNLVWSEASEPFRIAPWYENGPLPPVPVKLPDVSLESLKKIKPNVTFQVPAGLMDMLRSNEPKDFLEGNATEGSGAVNLDWFCGFNVPIITLCAFILLHVILSLLNWVFWWLPFVRICIPIPNSWSEDS